MTRALDGSNVAWRCALLAVVFSAGPMVPPALAQQPPATQPAVEEVEVPVGVPTTMPVGAEEVRAIVLEVTGDVQHAPLGSREWQKCAVGDEYPQQTKIRTGIRSAIKLQLGSEEPYTAMLIESVGLTVISEAYKTQETKRVRVGVGYGRIRAGVAEGGLQSDFTVDSPVATLSKRGTWNFGLAYERATDRFEIFLLDRGLVDALSKISGQQRTLLPGQAVTQAMRRWLDEAQIRRNVAVVDILGQEDLEIAFNRLKQSGLGVINIGEGQAPLLNLNTQFARNTFGDIISQSLASVPLLPPAQGGGPVLRPEGFFGTGRGEQLIPVIIEANNPLVQKGFAHPGRYLFRRGALEGWQRDFGGK